MSPRENTKNSLRRDTSVSRQEQKGGLFLFICFGQVVKNAFSVYVHFLSGEKFPFQGYFRFPSGEKRGSFSINPVWTYSEIRFSRIYPFPVRRKIPFLRILPPPPGEKSTLFYYFIGGIPRSLQIFFARMSLISVCLGTEERLFNSGFHHHECLLPSLSSWQSFSVRYARSVFRFIFGPIPHGSRLWRLRSLQGD